MTSIAFQAVSKRYGDVEAVQDLNLSCDPGEMLALLGPSGCGKSTTLKMAAGIESVSDGRILFGDRVVSDLSPGERNVAMVFEDYALYPHLSVFDNIAFPLKLRGLSRRELNDRIECGSVSNKAMWEIDYVTDLLRSTAGDGRPKAGVLRH
jgi:multiple sugar transport system ATP-binding protein